MKLFYSIFFVFLVVLLGGSACTKSDLSEEQGYGDLIGFEVNGKEMTKAVAVNTVAELASLSDVKVTALKYQQNWALLAQQPEVYMNKVSLTGTNTGSSPIVTTWSYSPKNKWPVGSYLSFFATAGSGISLQTSASAPYYPSYAVQDGNDAMIASPLLDKCNGSVPLQMNHVISRVGFSFKLSSLPSGVSSVIVKGIQLRGLNGVYSNAVYKYQGSQYVWDFSASTTYGVNSVISFASNEALTLNTSAFQDVCASSGYHFFIPQDLSSKTLSARVVYQVNNDGGTNRKDSVDISFSPTYAWSTGMPYNYNATLTVQTNSIVITPANSYSSVASSIDAHADRQPLYLSAKKGVAKITLSTEAQSWVQMSIPSTETLTNYNTDVAGVVYVLFTGGDGVSSLDRAIQLNFADNTPTNSTSFSTRQGSVVVQYYADATSVSSLGTLTQTSSFPYIQSAPHYVGAFGGYSSTSGSFTTGLVMENFSEYKINNFKGDNLLLHIDGLPFWNGNSGLSRMGNYDGNINTTTITNAGDATNAGIAGSYDANFNTYAARYCKSKGTGWYLPAPQQMRVMATYASTLAGDNPFPITDGTYWTSKVISTGYASVVSRTGTTVSMDTAPGITNATRNQIRCVKEVLINNDLPTNTVSIVDANNVFVDLGVGKIKLTTDNGSQNNFNQAKCTAPWRMATDAELIYLYRINVFLPVANRIGQFNYFFTNKAGGTSQMISFPNYTYTTVSTGTSKGGFRCVLDQ